MIQTASSPMACGDSGTDVAPAASQEQLRAVANKLRRDTNSVLADIDDPDLNTAARRLRSSVLECAEALVQLSGAYEHESRSRKLLQDAVAELRAQLAQAQAETPNGGATADIDDRYAIVQRAGSVRQSRGSMGNS